MRLHEEAAIEYAMARARLLDLQRQRAALTRKCDNREPAEFDVGFGGHPACMYCDDRTCKCGKGTECEVCTKALALPIAEARRSAGRAWRRFRRELRALERFESGEDITP